MKLWVRTVGRVGTPWAEEAIGDYRRRLGRRVTVAEDHLKPERFRGDVDAVRAAEGARLLRGVTPRDRLVCLDERGEALETPDFVKLVQRCRNDGTHRLVFAIGGPYGHDPAVRERAWRVVRLSSLVLNHEVARVVLYEQLYRVHTILEGGPYHH